MLFAAKYAWLLIAIAAWNALIWTMFARNLSRARARGEERARGYWIAHTVLIVINLIVAVVLAWVAIVALVSLD
ncbi:MAG: SCO4848 family membrane protein [Nocardioides sp.]